nr:MAG TPA: hypothetical protein [Caudoviricetes sp.]
MELQQMVLQVQLMHISMTLSQMFMLVPAEVVPYRLMYYL